MSKSTNPIEAGSLADRVCRWFAMSGNRGEERTPAEIATQYVVSKAQVVAQLADAVTHELLVFTQGEKAMVYQAGPMLRAWAAPDGAPSAPAAPRGRRSYKRLPDLDLAQIEVKKDVPIPVPKTAKGESRCRQPAHVLQRRGERCAPGLRAGDRRAPRGRAARPVAGHRAAQAAGVQGVMKHTPMPWRLEMRGDVWGVIGAGELPICTFPPTVPELAEEQIANMHLVKVAPVLLDALVALHRICRDCDLEHEAERPTEEQYAAAMDAAEAALAAAGPNVEGEATAAHTDR